MHDVPDTDSGHAANWAALIDLAPVPTFLVDDEEGAEDLGRIAYANTAARALLTPLTPVDAPCPPDASLGALVDADDRVNVGALLAQARAATSSDPVVGSITDSLGRTGTLHLRATPDGVIAQLVTTDTRSATDQILDQQKRFRSALMELSELAHTTRDDDDFYLRLIERAVEVVPGAQGGSVQLKLPDSTAFRFVAAVGYDLKGLQRHDLDQHQFFRDAWDPNARIIRNFDNAGRSPEVSEWLETVGRLSDIVVNVSGPVLSDGFPIAFLSLDNFEDADAMTETSVEMTTVLSRLIGDLWRRRQLEAEVRKEREAFKHLALHDPLTGLANRRNLERTLNDAMGGARRTNRPSCVLFIDLDDFKGVNDRLGHEVGDRLLIRAAEGLSDVVRAGDKVGRWGGDEFLVVPHRLETAEEAVELAERLLARFEDDIDLGNGLMYRARLSVGVGWSTDSQIAVDGLIGTADRALYEAKAAGKGISRVLHANSESAPASP